MSNARSMRIFVPLFHAVINELNLTAEAWGHHHTIPIPFPSFKNSDLREIRRLEIMIK